MIYDVELRAKDLGQFEVFIAGVLITLYNQVPVQTLLEQHTIQELHRPDAYSFVHQDIQMDLNGGGFCIYLVRLQMSNKGLIALNRLILSLMLRILLMILMNIGICNFESFCKDGESKMSYLVCGTGQCLKGKALQIGGAVGGICACVIFLMMQIPLNLFLFDKNYKHGGHLSTYSGSSSVIRYIILSGVMFGQRELVVLYFWRSLVTIGTAKVKAEFYMINEPYFRNACNILIASRYCIYGIFHLFMKIAYVVEI
ncbi:MAG: hypothetical protein EZS28_024524 [Streblomastix strix]|uniref:Uncharacterized protein n=1 Tax=Streblomastix strix TaxID=222440 RepID=A0A5J4VBN9_9EUKA|nr:MAG: hypothetical protein EZS28_024524 [Streblomastix strix]